MSFTLVYPSYDILYFKKIIFLRNTLCVVLQKVFLLVRTSRKIIYFLDVPTFYFKYRVNIKFELLKTLLKFQVAFVSSNT